MDRQASVLIADDMVMSLLGKINLSGIYTSDIVIPIDPFGVPQLVFLFSLETDVSDPFQHIQLQVIFPTQQPVEMSVSPPAIPPSSLPEQRTRLLMRQPFLIQQPLLRPGRIQAKVLHDKGEIDIASLPWISLSNQSASIQPNHSAATQPTQGTPARSS